MVEFIRWWYGAGWVQVMRSAGQRLRGLALAFSLPILIRTLFAPWRRIISYGDRSFEDSLRALLDNTVSRFVGFGVRLAVLLAALALIIITSLVSLVVIVAWPLLPAVGLALIIRGGLAW